MNRLVHAWRIATDTRDYTADDATGAGAKITGGRWNDPGTPVVYLAGSIALACLETLVHLNAGLLPLNRYLVRFDIPRTLIEDAAMLTHTTAPVGWDALPYGKVSLDVGRDWCRTRATALLKVPSVIVPEEQNILLNPLHPDAARITATKVRRWHYDWRVRQAAS